MKICSWHSAALNSSFFHCCSEINSRMPKRGMVFLRLPLSHRLSSFQQRWCASLYLTCCLLYHQLLWPSLSSPVPACYNCSSFQTSSRVDFLKQFLGHHTGVVLACPCLSFPSSLTASSAGILLIVLLGVNTYVSTTRLHVFFWNVYLGIGPGLDIY